MNLKNKHAQLPKIIILFLKIILSRLDFIQIVGDLEEVFNYRKSKNGKLKAILWLLKELLVSIPSMLISSALSKFDLLKSYLKTAFRNARKRKIYFLINISGLSIGLASSIIISAWVFNEINYDKVFYNHENIYRIIENFKFTDGAATKYGMCPDLISPALAKNYPEIVNSCRVQLNIDAEFNFENKLVKSEDCAVADSNFFRIFNYNFIEGSIANSLKNPNSVILSKSFAQQIFNNSSVIGKKLIIGKEIFNIDGVVEIPENTHLKFSALFQRKDGRKIGEVQGNPFFYLTYVELSKHADASSLNNKIKTLFKKIAPDNPAEVELSLQKFSDIYLHSNFQNDLSSLGSIDDVKTFSIIAILILVIACMNFINLTTAQFGKRAKEFTLRKVLGVQKSNLIFQFYTDVILHFLLAVIIAAALIYALLPEFKNFAFGNLPDSIFWDVKFIAGFALILIIAIAVSGFYPAKMISRSNPAGYLRNNFTAPNKGLMVRKILVISQFSISVILIVFTAVIFKQFEFINTKELGFQKEQIFYIPIDKIEENTDSFINSLSSIEGIVGATKVSELPVKIKNCTDFADWTGKSTTDNILFYLLSADFNTAKTFNFQTVNGRFFSENMKTDSVNSFILNETAVKAMGLQNPVGSSFTLWEKKGKIIGVVKDFHFASIKQKIEPLIITISSKNAGYLCVKYSALETKYMLSRLKSQWEKHFGSAPFQADFLDKNFEALYRNEQKQSSIILVFTILAIFISSLGIFGLSTFIAEQKTKEIGIRKVLGSSVKSLFAMQVKDFFKWVLLANLISIPISYLLVSEWLGEFSYRINVQIEVFLFAFVVSLLITIISVGYRSVKSAMLNPVDTLKNE